MTQTKVRGASLRLMVLKTMQLGKVRTFYQSLGIDFVEERHGKGPLHYAGRVGEAVLELYPLPVGLTTADHTTRLGFAVDGLEQVLESLRVTGTSVVKQPQGTAWGFRAVVQDPDGRAVELYQR
jgi:lactoylglutathione lyase